MATALVENVAALTAQCEGDRIAEELKRLAAANGGLLMPQHVVTAARPETSVLHGEFTWDDGEAAERYRLWEARQLIRVHVQVEPVGQKDVETRVFVSLTPDRGNGGGYRLTTAVMSNDEYRQQLLADALAELRVFQNKYAQLKELASVMKPIARLLSQ